MRIFHIGCLFSPHRLKLCRALFSNPWQTHFNLTFLRKGTFQAALLNGKKASFSRSDRAFWYWFFSSGKTAVDFTSDGEVLFGEDGLRLLLRPGTYDSHAFLEIFIKDTYGLKSPDRSLENVVDVGGNIGLFTCACLKRARRVVTVEPVSDNYRLACKNLTLNHGKLKDLLRYAVGGRSGELIPIYRDRYHTGSHSMLRSWVSGDGSYETVTTISLPDLLDRAGLHWVDFLKCDAEGAEYEIFLNTPSEVLKRIATIVLELHLSADVPPRLARRLIAHFESSGFKVSLDGKIPESLSRRKCVLILKARRPEASHCGRAPRNSQTRIAAWKRGTRTTCAHASAENATDPDTK